MQVTHDDIRQAIDGNQFALHYQPIVALSTREIIGVESLVRWNHPTRGLLLPAEFIPFAENTNLTIAIRDWTLRESLRQLSEWREAGLIHKKLTIAVNLSPKQFEAANLVDLVQRCLEERSIPAECLTIELTESSLIGNLSQARQIFRDLRRVGVSIDMDDFGTGYSSLSHLHSLPFHSIKIDRSFIRNIENSSESRAIARSIIQLGQALNMEVIAEGVETEEQKDSLERLGCLYGQGYLFSRPLAADVAGRLFATLEKGKVEQAIVSHTNANQRSHVSTTEERQSSVTEAEWFNKTVGTAKEGAFIKGPGFGLAEDHSEARCADLHTPLELIISMIEAVREPIVILDKSLSVKTANRAFYRIFGGSEKTTEEHSIYEISQGAWNVPALAALLNKVKADGRAYEELEIETRFPGAGPKALRINLRRLPGEAMIAMSVRDVTSLRRNEGELDRVHNELRQGQKMEVVGRLAGGVAHDFNNILTVILGFSQLQMRELEVGSLPFRQALEIQKASERAANLTQQLLAFSRQQVLRPRIMDLNAVVLDLNEMLKRLVGDGIELICSLDEHLGKMKGDQGQISQIVLNMVVNARDAMPQGGRISIGTANTQIADRGPTIRGLAMGDYVSLSITDTGMGMDQETQEHMFEPFFTTKPQGSGTGLGLATVLGIVEQSGGNIDCSSQPGLGTTFWIDFPLVEGEVAVHSRQEYSKMASGTETVLVVDDDEIVRELVVVVLRTQGYQVLTAEMASEALEIIQSETPHVDLILTDFCMTGGMDGRQLAKQAKELRVGIGVLLMSGYTDTSLLNGVEDEKLFLQKPFTIEQLAGRVREVLDSVASVGTDGKAAVQ